MDKDGADPSTAVTGLLEEGVLLEEFGGETQCAHISAKTGTGLDDLLDKISLQVSPYFWYIIFAFSASSSCVNTSGRNYGSPGSRIWSCGRHGAGGTEGQRAWVSLDRLSARRDPPCWGLGPGRPSARARPSIDLRQRCRNPRRVSVHACAGLFECFIFIYQQGLFEHCSISLIIRLLV